MLAEDGGHDGRMRQFPAYEFYEHTKGPGPGSSGSIPSSAHAKT